MGGGCCCYPPLLSTLQRLFQSMEQFSVPKSTFHRSISWTKVLAFARLGGVLWVWDVAVLQHDKFSRDSWCTGKESCIEVTGRRWYGADSVEKRMLTMWKILLWVSKCLWRSARRWGRWCTVFLMAHMQWLSQNSKVVLWGWVFWFLLVVCFGFFCLWCFGFLFVCWFLGVFNKENVVASHIAVNTVPWLRCYQGGYRAFIKIKLMQALMLPRMRPFVLKKCWRLKRG